MTTKHTKFSVWMIGWLLILAGRVSAANLGIPYDSLSAGLASLVNRSCERTTLIASNRFAYSDDFSTPRFLKDAFPENLSVQQWQAGQVTNAGPDVRALVYRFYGKRAIKQIEVEVEQSAESALGGVNNLYLSSNGLDWELAASSSSQKPNPAGRQSDPLSVPAEKAMNFLGKSEVWIRLLLSNGSGLKTVTSNTIRLFRVSLTLGESAADTDPQAISRAAWGKLRQTSGWHGIDLDYTDPATHQAPHYYEDSDGYLQEPGASPDLAVDESAGFCVQHEYVGWHVPPADLNPPRRPLPSRYPLSLVMFARVESGSPLMAAITVRCDRTSSRNVNVRWDGKPVGRFDAGRYFNEDHVFFVQIPEARIAGLHELRIAGHDRGNVLIRRVTLAGSQGRLNWTTRPELPPGNSPEILSAYYMPDPEPPADSETVEKHLQKLCREHGDFGAVRAVLRNRGRVPVRISGLRLNDQPIEDSYVDFVKSEWDARGVVWYRVRPQLLPPGECAQVYIRFRRRPSGDQAALTLNFVNAKPVKVAIPYQDSGFALDYVTTGKTGDVLYVYARRSSGIDPGRVTGLSLDGTPIEKARIYGANFPGNIALVVARLPRALRTGSYHVVGVKTSGGKTVAAQFRVLPFVFVRSAINVPPELCQPMHMNHAMWTQTPLEVCEKYGITTTSAQCVNGASVFDTHRLVSLVAAPDEADANDNVGGWYYKGLGYNARLMSHAGWPDLVERFAPQAATWLNIDGTTRPLNWMVYGQFADISGFDPYPVTYYSANQPFVGESLSLVRQCSTPNRFIACLEAFGWPLTSEPGFAEGISGYGRGPIPAECRQNGVQAIAAGMKGVTDWVYTAAVSGWQIYPSATQAIAALNALIESIEEDLLLGTPIDLASCDTDLVPTGPVGQEKWPKKRVQVGSLLCGPDTIVVTAVNHIPASKPKPPMIKPAHNLTVRVQLPEYLKQVNAFEATETGLVPFPSALSGNKLTLKIDSLESGRVFVLRRLRSAE